MDLGTPGLSLQIHASPEASFCHMHHCYTVPRHRGTPLQVLPENPAIQSAREPQRVHGKGGTLGVTLTAVSGAVVITISQIPVVCAVSVDGPLS